ncbi:MULTISPECIES: hypothetical protein [unclassified Streptomyces]|uniref:hypothetical protein n=1 Tax=unclassified Streptomyces TaxID=2593676 RepID=UPI00342136AE
MTQQKAEKPKDTALPAPPEFKFTWGQHNETMERLSLTQMARRVPSALAQTAKLAWSNWPPTTPPTSPSAPRRRKRDPPAPPCCCRTRSASPAG